jgi:hypothetical protein
LKEPKKCHKGESKNNDDPPRESPALRDHRAVSLGDPIKEFSSGKEQTQVLRLLRAAPGPAPAGEAVINSLFPSLLIFLLILILFCSVLSLARLVKNHKYFQSFCLFKIFPVDRS